MIRLYRKSLRTAITITSVLCLLVISPIHAQNTYDLDGLEEGQLVLNLNATEQTSVEQDTLNVFMQYTAQGRDTAALQNEVNEAIRDARNILDDTDNIDFSIQQYQVYPVNRNNAQPPAWRAQQGIQMQSMNSAALLVVTARLQENGLTISNMSFSLSSEQYETISDSLLEAALRKLQARAQEVAAILGKDDVELIEISINGSQNFFGNRNLAVMEMRSATASSMAVPVAEPGETEVSMTVSARALLSD